VSVIRPFNTFGPRQSARAVIPTIIEQLLSGRPTIKLGALNPTRDLTFVKDTVAAFTSVARADGAVGEVINIGSGFEIAIGELLETIKGLVGSSASVEVDEQRLRPEASEVDRLCADVAKARRLLDWQPAYSGREGLLRGLRETVEWFQRRLADGRQPAGAGAFRL
jgi:dTDP-glucose 4,6-dehydratase